VRGTPARERASDLRDAAPLVVAQGGYGDGGEDGGEGGGDRHGDGDGGEVETTRAPRG